MRRIAALLLVVGLGLGVGIAGAAQPPEPRPRPIEVAAKVGACMDWSGGRTIMVEGSLDVASIRFHDGEPFAGVHRGRVDPTLAAIYDPNEAFPPMILTMPEGTPRQTYFSLRDCFQIESLNHR